ncbi:carbohydrate kinase family protein [Streptomyces sp. CdTB01]|uniref:carbohydrate kinase family protein n=1 Tax=Streptomyces sp. CdTB01 TaxID=1725411 RepID=UPI00073A5F86|nr:carbohydrate kinase family protein [Streptomyces sp. CdTB01]ALV31079.1 carbohydrate kinase [Streptomyces sp. CdTB01]
MPHSFDLLVIGDANPDVVVGPLDGPLAFGQREQLVPTGTLTVGGSGAIVACGAARLGLRVAFAGRVGDDDAGRYMRDRLIAHGVDTEALRLDPHRPTPMTVVLTRGDDRAIVTAPGTLAATTADDVPAALLGAARHVHSASYFLMPQLAVALPELLRTARRHGAGTSLDTNDDPSGRWEAPGLDAVLAHTDVLLPNAAEARRLARLDTDDIATAAARLARRGPVTAVKNGADGALCHDGERLFTTQGIRVRPVDAVGAGDSFDAGFIAALLDETPLPQALRFAAVCGALSTRAHGGTTAQPTRDEVLARLSETEETPV